MKHNLTANYQQGSTKGWLIALLAIVFVAGGVVAYLYMNPTDDTAPAGEEQPQTFDADDPDSYIGLSEREALDRASEADKVARVVSRDGEALTVTMDLRLGRLNFTVVDDVVTAVEVEGGNIQDEQLQPNDEEDTEQSQ